MSEQLEIGGRRSKRQVETHGQQRADRHRQHQRVTAQKPAGDEPSKHGQPAHGQGVEIGARHVMHYLIETGRERLFGVGQYPQ